MSKKTKIIQESEREKALEKIGGYISADGNNVIYYDESMRKWYVTPASELDCMVTLMNDPDPETRVSAYSHWCAGTSAEEFDTEGEAIAATS